MSNYTFREQAGADSHAPVFFVFHGTGGDENQFFELAGQLLSGARIIAVRGDVSEHGALRYFRRTGEGVYDMEDLEVRTAAMASFVSQTVGDSDPMAVVGLGYSNGANILASVQFTRPELFDASILMHPLIPFTPPARPGLADRRILITAGRRDPICPASASEALASYFKAQGADTELFWHDGGHELRREELLQAQSFLGLYRTHKA